MCFLLLLQNDRACYQNLRTLSFQVLLSCERLKILLELNKVWLFRKILEILMIQTESLVKMSKSSTVQRNRLQVMHDLASRHLPLTVFIHDKISAKNSKRFLFAPNIYPKIPL